MSSSSSPRMRIAATISASGMHFGLAEHPLDLVVERACDVHQLTRSHAGALQQRPIGAQTREAQVGEPRLPRAQQLALSAKLEVDLRQLEPVARGDQRLEPCD